LDEAGVSHGRTSNRIPGSMVSVADGEDIRSLVLWGLEIYWWARISKIAALLGGLAIVIDIVGQDRLKIYLETHQFSASRKISALLASVFCLSLLVPVVLQSRIEKESISRTLAFIFVLLSAMFMYYAIKPRLISIFSWVYTHENFLRTARVTSLFLLLTAFHFDFLAT
jgi:hypothetical protein